MKIQPNNQGPAGVSASDMTGGLCFLLFTSGDPEKISCVQRCVCFNIDNNDNDDDKNKHETTTSEDSEDQLGPEVCSCFGH